MNSPVADEPPFGLPFFAPLMSICRKLPSVDAYWGGNGVCFRGRKRVKNGVPPYPPSCFTHFFTHDFLITRL
jgi:hypothetical protein